MFASARSAGREARRAHGRGGDARGARARATSTSSSSRSAPAPHASSSPTRSRAARRDRQVVGLPAPGRDPARRAGGERRARARQRPIIANPNCCTIPLTCVLKPLHEEAGLVARPRGDLPVGLGRRRPGDGSARARSAGRARPAHGLGVRRRGVRRGVEAPRRDPKIMELPELPLQASCVRVPVMVGHAEVDLDRDRGRALRRAGARAARRRALGPARGVPRPRQARPASTRCSSGASAATRPSSGPRALPRERQPAQGRGAERDPDRRARARTLRRSAERGPISRPAR